MGYICYTLYNEVNFKKGEAGESEREKEDVRIEL